MWRNILYLKSASSWPNWADSADTSAWVTLVHMTFFKGQCFPITITNHRSLASSVCRSGTAQSTWMDSFKSILSCQNCTRKPYEWNPCERVSHFPLEAVNDYGPFPWQAGDATAFYRVLQPQIAEEMLLLKNKQNKTKNTPRELLGRSWNESWTTARSFLPFKPDRSNAGDKKLREKWKNIFIRKKHNDHCNFV